MADLSTSYMGLKLKSPIIAGSSGLSTSVKNLVEMEKYGAGAIVLKSIFEEQIRYETEKLITDRTEAIKVMGKAYDDILSEKDDVYTYQEAQSYLTNFAQEHTLNEYLNFIREAKKAVSIPVIASINCVSAYKWQYFARRIQEAGADAIELNIYVLPSDPSRSSVQNEQIYTEIYNEVKKYTTLPVSIKLGYYFSSLSSTLQLISQSGISAMVLFNRPYSPDLDIRTNSLTSGGILSQPGEHYHTLRWVAMLAGKLGCDIAAATGIQDGDTVAKMILAGANTVQVTSCLYKSGIEQLQVMLQGLENWMKEMNYNSLDDFRGKMCQSNLENPAVFERVQFMKLYSEIE